MKVFVTGADGFIGSHLVEHLLKEGHAVTALALYQARDSYGWLDAIDHQQLQKIRGDIRDGDLIADQIRGHEICFHLAALNSVPWSYRSPVSFIETNIKGTLNVAQACAKWRVALVHTSTSEVYGNPRVTVMREDTPALPTSVYAASKLAADHVVEATRRVTELECVTLRPFNNYGPRQSMRAVIPQIISQCKSGETVITLGSVYTERDFLYVSDTCRAYVAVAKLMDGQVYNCGSGHAHRIIDVVERVQAILDTEKEVRWSEERARPDGAEVRFLRAGFEKLNDATGWMPTITLDEGLRLTIAGIEQQGGYIE